MLGVPAPWQLPSVSGVGFADAAWAFDKFVDKRIGVVGWGIYVGGGFWPALRWNWMWITEDYHGFRSKAPAHEFFIAYNF